MPKLQQQETQSWAGPHCRLPSNPRAQPRNCRRYRGEALAQAVAGVDIGIVCGTADVVMVGEALWAGIPRGIGLAEDVVVKDGGGLITVGHGIRSSLGSPT